MSLYDDNITNSENESFSADSANLEEELTNIESGSAPPKNPDETGSSVTQGNIAINVTVSTDALEGYVTIRTPPRTKVPRTMVDEAIAKEGIIQGIDNDKIDELCEPSGVRGHPVTIASGRRPGAGRRASIEFFFDTDPKPKLRQRKNGKVDYRETGVIQQIEKGGLLALKTPAATGDEGISVTGKVIKGKPGKDAILQRGSGTKFEDEEKCRLVAAMSGCAQLHKDGVVEVSNEYIVNSDIDYKTGNIRFDGTVIVKGNVKSGFSVIATGDLEIAGIVEDANIYCGRNLLVKGGFVGSGKGVCRVFGETHIKFLENQTVYGNGDIYVAEEIVHGRVYSRGQVFVKFGKGAIIGGEVYGREGIEAKILGNIHYLKTKLIVGQDSQMDDAMEKIEKLMNVKDITREKMQAGINNMVSLKYSEDGLSDEEEKDLEYLYHVLGNFDKWVDLISMKQEVFIEERQRLDLDTYVLAKVKAFPNVIIGIDNLVKQIDTETGRMIFRLENGVIEGGRPSGYEEEQRNAHKKKVEELREKFETAFENSKAKEKEEAQKNEAKK